MALWKSIWQQMHMKVQYQIQVISLKINIITGLCWHSSNNSTWRNHSWLSRTRNIWYALVQIALAYWSNLSSAPSSVGHFKLQCPVQRVEVTVRVTRLAQKQKVTERSQRGQIWLLFHCRICSEIPPCKKKVKKRNYKNKIVAQIIF